ncbi:MAG: hypothetical protein ACAH80_08660 [Alphaproteobacteria bacterium]
MPEKVYAVRFGDDEPVNGTWIDTHDPIGQPETLYVRADLVAGLQQQLISNLALKLARAAEYMDHFVYHAMQGKPAPLGEDNLVELQAMKTPEEPVEMPKLRALVAGGEGAAVYLFRTDAELTTAIFKCLFHGEATPAQQEEVEGYHQALLAGFDVELSDGWLRLCAVTED